MAAQTIETRDYGTADFVTEIHFSKSIEWGGFRAYLTCGQDNSGTDERTAILLAAIAFKGPQPRLVIEFFGHGYADWRKLLDAAPESSDGMMRVVGSAKAAHNSWDQWLTHGASDLL